MIQMKFLFKNIKIHNSKEGVSKINFFCRKKNIREENFEIILKKIKSKFFIFRQNNELFLSLIDNALQILNNH